MPVKFQNDAIIQTVNLVTSRDLTIRRLIRYWNGPLAWTHWLPYVIFLNALHFYVLNIASRFTLHRSLFPRWWFIIIRSIIGHALISYDQAHVRYPLSNTISSLVQTVAYRLFGTKILPGHMLTWCQSDAWLSSLQATACRLFSAKPLPEPIRIYCQMAPIKRTSVKFQCENTKLFIQQNAYEYVVC